MSHAKSFKTFKEAREFLKKNLKQSINLFDDLICRDDVEQSFYGGRIVHFKRMNPNWMRSGNSFQMASKGFYGIETKTFIESYKVKLQEE